MDPLLSIEHFKEKKQTKNLKNPPIQIELQKEKKTEQHGVGWSTNGSYQFQLKTYPTQRRIPSHRAVVILVDKCAWCRLEF